MGAAGAVPGFPIGGGTDPQGGGVPTYYLDKFSPKMHENEKISGHGGVTCWEDPSPLRSATALISHPG